MHISARRLTKLILALTFLTVWGCTKVPYTERSQFMMVSDKEEIRIGEKSFARVKRRSKISYDLDRNLMLRRVGRRIAAAVDRPAYKWEFIVIRSSRVNAFALPGGKVAFYSGIFPMTRDENGVAAVMGHEVAHVLARHGAERLSQSRALRVGRIALSIALAGAGASSVAQDSVLGAYGIGSKVGVMLPFSRSHESEADEIGLYLMAKAGYDPRASVKFWKRMDARKKRSRFKIELLSTHPGAKNRIARLEELMPKAMEIYRAAREKGAGARVSAPLPLLTPAAPLPPVKLSPPTTNEADDAVETPVKDAPGPEETQAKEETGNP